MNTFLVNRRRPRLARSLVGVGLTCLLFALAAVATAADEQQRPNIVIVLVDDMGWADLSCFGGVGVVTEHIDRLAKEGIAFTNFYVNSPICSPSRTALTTGQYPARWRITSFLSNRAANEERGMAQWLDPQAPTLARTLQQAGYVTGHFGKWHLGGQRDVGEAPAISQYGFNASLTNFEGLGPRVLPLCDAYDGQPPKKHALGSDNLGRGPITWENRSLVTAAFVKAAVQFIDSAARENRPFYINVWPDDVHSPFFPPETRRGDGQKRTLYQSVLDTMDEQLGVLFDRIRQDERLRENTIIVVTSDNGPEPGAGLAGVFRGNKGTLFEGGIRSPLIVWGPGFISADGSGTKDESSILAAFDLYPSLLSIAGIHLPETVKTDGTDASQTLLGKSRLARATPLFWRRPPDRPGPRGARLPDLAVREGKWKLLVRYDGRRPLLYDLERDPSESNDLAEMHSDVTSRLTKAVLTWNAALPQDAGNSGETP